ncbi:hypothetical protein GQ53DRAFT_82913 [Thozetella sp. PMI_491]|nr:hypothetical protein GQ53DRAFT_82913 [Thozetella sp. PMI_491]
MPTKQLISPFLMVSRESRHRALSVYSTKIPVSKVEGPHNLVSKKFWDIRPIDGSSHVDDYYENFERWKAAFLAVHKGNAKERGLIHISLKQDLFVIDWTPSEERRFLPGQEFEVVRCELVTFVWKLKRRARIRRTFSVTWSITTPLSQGASASIRRLL